MEAALLPDHRTDLVSTNRLGHMVGRGLGHFGSGHFGSGHLGRGHYGRGHLGRGHFGPLI